MRSLIAILALALASTGIAFAQPLTCPTVSAVSGRPCETFHFHVAAYRPDTRTLTEFSGINQFASQSACDRARDAQFKRNMAVVEFFRSQRNQQQYPADQFGPCHCDMTVEKSSPNVLTDLQRAQQIRQAEEIRQRVRERLLDAGLQSDSELIRGLMPSPPSSLLGGPKLVAMPERSGSASITNAPEDLKTSSAVDTSTPPVASLDLPLVDISTSGVATADVPSTATSVVAAVPPPVASAPASPPPASPPVASPPAAAGTEISVTPATSGNEGPLAAPAPQPELSSATPTVEEAPADDAADVFVAYETERIQNVFAASSVITDETTKSKVNLACIQRVQLLSNLRLLIQGSGAHSRLATEARNAKHEEQRLALVSKFFGSDILPHWAPKDATDVIINIKPDVDPENVLRDVNGKHTDQQKRHALYVFLARTQLTEQQQLWLSTLIDSLLQ